MLELLIVITAGAWINLAAAAHSSSVNSQGYFMSLVAAIFISVVSVLIAMTLEM